MKILKYQKTISKNAIPIAKLNNQIDPLIIDYSYSYPDNIYSDEIIASGVSDLGELINIPSDNIILTKDSISGKPLFYEYQLKNDVTNIETIQVFDENGDIPTYKIEVGTPVDPSGNNLSDYNLYNLNDLTLENFNRNIIASGTSDYPIYDIVPEDSDSVYKIKNNVLRTGEIQYDILDITVLGLYFYISSSTSQITILQDSNVDGINLSYISNVLTLQIGSSTWTYEGLSSSWYRIVCTKNSNNIKVYLHKVTNYEYVKMDENSLDDELAATFPDVLKVNCSHAFIAQLFFGGDNSIYITETDTDNWPKLLMNRYENNIVWTEADDETNARVRILFEDDKAYNIIYDALDENQEVIKNKLEYSINKLIYPQQRVNENGVWILTFEDNSWTITFDDLTWYEEDVWLKIETYSLNIGMDNSKRVYLTKGDFESNGLTFKAKELDNILYANDGINEIFPKTVKIFQESPFLVDKNRIQIYPFHVYEGNYPDYKIPYFGEVVKVFSSTGITTTYNEPITWKSSRGLSIYINERRLDNSLISNINPNNGIIELDTTINEIDNVRVSYLMKIDNYYITFPNINIENIEGFRIYIKYWEQDYEELYNWDDSEDRVYYRLLDHNQPIGEYLSCRTNEPISDKFFTHYPEVSGVLPSQIIQLGDVIVTSVVDFEDIRINGGGILDEEKYDDFNNVKNIHKLSRFNLDTIMFGGQVLPLSIAVIKISQTLMSEIESEQDDPMKYLETKIMEYLASGVYYIIVDENHIPYSNPYPEVKR